VAAAPAEDAVQGLHVPGDERGLPVRPPSTLARIAQGCDCQKRPEGGNRIVAIDGGGHQTTLVEAASGSVSVLSWRPDFSVMYFARAGGQTNLVVDGMTVTSPAS
jgi:hypothetical protein